MGGQLRDFSLLLSLGKAMVVILLQEWWWFKACPLVGWNAIYVYVLELA
jgi:hypothetical protein